MTIGRQDDLAYSILLITPFLLYASMGTDPVHTGTWYLLVTPVVTLLPGLILRAPALFLTGTTAAVLASLSCYLSIIFNQARTDGLLALGHLFSMPGMLLGTGLSAWLLRFRVNASLPWLVAGIAFLGATLGFMIVQMVVCTTVMYCSALSFGVWG